MKILFSNQPPQVSTPSIFLAGPTPRTRVVTSWRKQALALLEALRFTGMVLVPEGEGWEVRNEYINQVEWEFHCLEVATVICFWVPRDLTTLPGFTTNVEFGRYVGSGRCVYGRPTGSVKNRYLDWLYTKVTSQQPYDDLHQTLAAAVQLAHKRTGTHP